MKIPSLALLTVLASTGMHAQWGGELRLCLHSEPRTLHPALVDDDASETVRYLTGGVLLRVNRVTQQLEPEIAASWKIGNGGQSIGFKLREGLSFSDGTPFTADDVAYTMQVLMDPALHSPAVAAANALGAEQDYDPVPYFWSEQFGRMVQYVGHHEREDRLVWRGDPAQEHWTACWVAGTAGAPPGETETAGAGRLVAVLTVGRPRDMLQGRRLMQAGQAVDIARLADPGIPVRDAAMT